MRVVLTDDVADDARALLRRAVVAVRQFLLREQDAPVYRFQAVADVRDGSPDEPEEYSDRLAEFFFYVDLRMLSVLRFRHVRLAGRISTVAAQRGKV
ncbi:MAG: hypothetical protein ACLU4B_03380 [Bilophila wadsworthia]